MKHTLIEVKTGNVTILDDDIEEEKKEYLKKYLTADYMEWFIS